MGSEVLVCGSAIINASMLRGVFFRMFEALLERENPLPFPDCSR